MKYKYLDQINSPDDLKKFSEKELVLLCADIRDYLIKIISKTGGHLASNLGTVELIVAIHRIFNSPHDKLVFDVGHQCYTHKLLTGRREQFISLRQKNGLSGFPKPNESPHDAFIAGHSSTSISAAYGIAKAFSLKGKPDYAIALIGDGALTGGEAYEALNNAGRSKTRLIVILNHNDQSISKNVGAFARYLSSMRSKPSYLNFKRSLDKALYHIPLVGNPIRNSLECSKSIIKTIIYRTTFFEEMGFTYLGPIDGHNIFELLRVLSRAKEFESPVIIQVETKKGKGYSYAEANPGAYHSISHFDILNGIDNNMVSDSYSNQSGEEITRLADKNDKICAITAAMKYATGLHSFYAAHKDRFFDVGIAEEHAVTFAGGLAAEGMLPVFCVYSSFLQRGYDQVIHDLSIDNKHAVLCVDRAGIVGEDGETHQGVFDVGFLSQIPNMTLYSPEGYDELKLCIDRAILSDTGVVAVRYPRGKEKLSHNIPPTTEYSFIDNASELLLVSYGRIFSNCWLAADMCKHEEISVSLLKLTKICPLENKVFDIVSSFKSVIFIEEGIRGGGIAEQLASGLLERGYHGKFTTVAIDGFVPQGDVTSIIADLHMDEKSIVKLIKQEMKSFVG